MSTHELIYPTLDLFLYDLREGLGQSSAIIDGNRKDFWGKIYPQIDDSRLAELAKAEKPEADYVRLLGSQKIAEFEPPYDGHFFPVQLGDTYALQADCSGKYAEPSKKTRNLAKQPVDGTVATLKQIIVSRINGTPEEKELPAGKRGTLGQTWLFWAQLASENQDVEETAKACYTQLVGESWKRDFQGEGDFMGARVFELWRFPSDWSAGWKEFSQENQHVLIFLFPAGEDIGKIRQNMPKIYFDCMRLFCYRHKVIWAYWQSRRLKAALKEKYRAAREFNSQIAQQLAGQRASLNQLQKDLTKALKDHSDYTEALTKLESQLRTIKVNFANFQKRQKNFTNPLDKSSRLEFIIKVGESDFNPGKYQEQIESDCANLSAGLKLLENLSRNIEGIVEIEQTRSERSLTFMVGVAGIGLAASGVTASVISSKPPNNYKDISFLKSPAFVLSIGIGVVLVASAFLIREIGNLLYRLRRRRSDIK
jgi:hypothetical protein